MKINFQSYILLIFGILAISCKESADLNTLGKRYADNEIIQESLASEIDDLALKALNSNSEIAVLGKVFTLDDRFSCAEIIFSDINTQKTYGTMTIDFGTVGCKDKYGNIRKGQLAIEWTDAKMFTIGSVYTIMPVNFSINDIRISGRRTHKCSWSDIHLDNSYTIRWNITAYNVFAWPDHSNASRDIFIMKTWSRETGSNGFIDKFIIDSNTTDGVNRYQKEFAVTTVGNYYYDSYSRANKVYIPNAGSETLSVFDDHTNVTGISIELDFNGSNVYEVTINGVKSGSMNARNDDGN